jgi:hypothetical protein
MPRRITNAFFAAAAAGATITTLGLAASPAGAAASGTHYLHFTPSAPETGTDANCTTLLESGSTGTWTSADCGKVGYVATGRNFRYASAIIKVPTIASAATSVITGPAAYVALDASASNPDYAEVGIKPDPDADGSWVAFYDIEEPGSPGITHTVALSPALAGDGVLVSVYLNAAGNSVHVQATVPSTTLGLINQTISVTGPVYTDAQAFADWTGAAEDAIPAPAVPLAKTRVTQFFQGRFTTLSGSQGTFKGPWTLTAVDATTNGSVEPLGTLIGQPSFLWNDGSSFNSLGNDAFGVWLYPTG